MSFEETLFKIMELGISALALFFMYKLAVMAMNGREKI